MEKYRFGSANVYVEGDLIVSVNEGPATLEVVEQFLALVETIYAQHGRCFLIVDATRIYSITQDARRYLVEWSKRYQLTAVAVYGASVLMRGVFALAGRAMDLLGRSRSLSGAYFSTEAEAREWIDEQRRKLLANQS